LDLEVDRQKFGGWHQNSVCGLRPVPVYGAFGDLHWKLPLQTVPVTSTYVRVDAWDWWAWGQCHDFVVTCTSYVTTGASYNDYHGSQRPSIDPPQVFLLSTLNSRLDLTLLQTLRLTLTSTWNTMTSRHGHPAYFLLRGSEGWGLAWHAATGLWQVP